MQRDSHDLECAGAALAARLERATKEGDKATAKECRKIMRELNHGARKPAHTAR